MENLAEQLRDGRSVTFWRTMGHAVNIINAAIGLNDGNDHTERWTDFRSALIDEKGLDEMRNDPDFKLGLYRVCRVADLAIKINNLYGHQGDEKENREEAIELAEELLSDSQMDDKGDYKSILKLKEALEIISKNAYHHGIQDEDIADLRIILNTIISCHEMVLRAAHEEKRKPVMQAA